MSYKVDLPIFEGPLDLLLHLIKKEEIDIYDIPIAGITAQYMEYIKMMKILDIDVAGEFIVMASTLMHIKSKMLLPDDRLDQDGQQEDPREELVKQLLEYKRFKEMAGKLQVMEEHHSRFFKRSFLDDIPSQDDGFLHDVDIFDLMSAFKTILENLPKTTEYEVSSEGVTVAEKILETIELLKDKDSVLFAEIFKANKTREGAVATFLALLELCRLRKICIVQENEFGHIMLYKGEYYERDNTGREQQERSE